MLPTNVAAGIAAGETIERPASVVKELVENALDAGARAVRIDVRGGGLELIRVGDDGQGIRAADLWLACQRHATSKFPTDGLASVRTLGFRGEALPSIAGVAELDLVSATRGGAAGGWRLTLRGGRVLRDEPAARAPGTTVTVRGLFADLPARRAAFAGSQNRTEMSQISTVVRRLALAAPDVRFSLYSDDRLTLQSSGSGDLLSVIAETHGQALLPALLPLGPVEIGWRTHSRRGQWGRGDALWPRQRHAAGEWPSGSRARAAVGAGSGVPPVAAQGPASCPRLRQSRFLPSAWMSTCTRPSWRCGCVESGRSVRRWQISCVTPWGAGRWRCAGSP